MRTLSESSQVRFCGECKLLDASPRSLGMFRGYKSDVSVLSCRDLGISAYDPPCMSFVRKAPVLAAWQIMEESSQTAQFKR